MKFDFETQNFINTLQEMLQDYGRMALTDGKKCYSLWLDYAPHLLEEGELLKVFLELGLGVQVVELKNCTTEERSDWRKQAVENMVHAGETQKDAASLVDAVLEVFGWGAKQEPVKTVQLQTEEVKHVETMNPVKQQVEQNGWLYILNVYMPKIFSVYCVDFQNLELPEYIMEVLREHLGEDGIQQHKFFAYGHDKLNGIWMVFSKSAVIVKEKEFHVVQYNSEGPPFLLGALVGFEDPGGFLLDMGIKNCYLIAMLRLMLGQTGDSVITRDEWIDYLCAYGGKIFKFFYLSDINSIYHAKQQLTSTQKSNVQNRIRSAHINEDEILTVVDRTTLGSCKNVIIFTENAIYQEPLNKVSYADIIHMDTESFGAMPVTLKGNKLEYICVYDTPQKKAIEALVFVKQNSQ